MLSKQRQDGAEESAILDKSAADTDRIRGAPEFQADNVEPPLRGQNFSGGGASAASKTSTVDNEPVCRFPEIKVPAVQPPGPKVHGAIGGLKRPVRFLCQVLLVAVVMDIVLFVLLSTACS